MNKQLTTLEKSKKYNKLITTAVRIGKTCANQYLMMDDDVQKKYV